MEKSKNSTIAIIAVIFIYTMIATFNLITKMNKIYLYVINPLFWVILAVILRIAFGQQLGKTKIKKKILEYVLIASLVYVLAYMISGLVVTFGKNPYSTKLKGFCINLWIFGVVIIAKEYIRYRLINNVYEKDKTTIAILISVVYILFEMQINTFFSQEVTTILLIKKTAQEFLPLIAKNVLYSYIAINCDCVPSILYELITKIYMWTSPILPNLPWIMVSIINTFIPVVLYIYIRFEKNKNDYYKNRENLTKLDPKNMIVLFILIIMAIWFSLGIFPLKPVAIASGSMEKAINIGDIVIIKKCNANDVIVGDVIQYQMKGFTVIHRVIEKRQKNGEYYFVTKGDNNKSPDKAEVRENQVLGKLVFTVKYLGYPAVWLHLISTEDQVKI